MKSFIVACFHEMNKTWDDDHTVMRWVEIFGVSEGMIQQWHCILFPKHSMGLPGRTAAPERPPWHHHHPWPFLGGPIPVPDRSCLGLGFTHHWLFATTKSWVQATRSTRVVRTFALKAEFPERIASIPGYLYSEGPGVLRRSK